MSTFTRTTPSIDHETITARNVGLQDLVTLLQEADERKIDIVTPATSLVAWKGDLLARGAEQSLTSEGVTSTDAVFSVGSVAAEGIADKIGVPIKYLRTLLAERPDLFDANVNGWLLGGVNKHAVVAEPDPRSFLLRGYRARTEGEPGFLRAVLSSKYQIADNLPLVMAMLEGVKESGLKVTVDSADVSERGMRVRLTAPEVAVAARTLLKGYRSPFNGRTGEELPLVRAGLVFSNSEVGSGAMQMKPEVHFEVCDNRATIDPLAKMRRVHLGGEMQHGTIRWSETTQAKNLDLTRSMTIDAIRTFLSPEYLSETIERLERKADTEVRTVDHVRDVTKKAGFTKEQTEGILSHFLSVAQPSLAGVFNAATSFSQTVTDADEAASIEAIAANVLA